MGDAKIIALGKITLVCRENPEWEKKIVPFEGQINRIWNKAVQKRSGRTNGKIVNYSGIEKISQGHYRVSGHLIDYKQFMADKSQMKGSLGIAPVAVSGISVFDQDSILFARRTKVCEAYPGFWELVPSGSLDSSCISADGRVDYHQKIKEEFEEETCMPSVHIQSCEELGIIYDGDDRVYDICCLLRIKNISPPQALEAMQQSCEYADPQFIKRADIPYFLNEYHGAVLPTSRCLMNLWLTHHSGHDGIDELVLIDSMRKQ